MKYRVAFLYSRLAPYTLACLRELKKEYQAEILGVFRKPTADAPFLFDQEEIFAKSAHREELNFQELLELVCKFSPHVIYVPGWIDIAYLRVANFMKKRGVPVIAGLDGQWRGTMKQWLAVTVGKRVLHECIDVLWATGERQAQYARRLGFRGDRLWYGFYCCDWDLFSRAYDVRNVSRGNGFLFVGRYAKEKGIETLLRAYKLYRSRVADPLPLVLAGAGPLKYMLDGCEGVTDLGFVQSERLPSIFGAHSFLVLPSSYEPWGVVIQEAAAAGLIVIASDECGASVHLVQDGYSGYIFEAGSAEGLSSCFERATALSVSERAAMSEAGRLLSMQFTPSRWAKTFSTRRLLSRS